MQRTIVTVILCGLALTACSATTTTAAPKVATLQSHGQSAAAATTTTAARPRLKLVMTQQDWDVLLAPYNKCLLAHGLTEQNGKIGEPQVLAGQSALVTAARDACADQYPLPAWENDPKNPDALDFNRQVAACLRAKGVREVDVTTSDSNGFSSVGLSFGGQDNDQQSITLGLEYADTCEQQVSQHH